MEYQSNVRIVLSKTCYAQCQILENIPKYLNNFTKSIHKGIILYEIRNTKWYSSFPEVQEVHAWLDTLEEESYGFIRVGENPDDIAIYGTLYEFGLFTSTDICFEPY